MPKYFKTEKSLPKTSVYVFPNLHANICFVCFPELRLVYVAIQLISTSVSCFQQGLNLHSLCVAIFVPCTNWKQIEVSAVMKKCKSLLGATSQFTENYFQPPSCIWNAPFQRISAFKFSISLEQPCFERISTSKI